MVASVLVQLEGHWASEVRKKVRSYPAQRSRTNQTSNPCTTLAPVTGFAVASSKAGAMPGQVGLHHLGHHVGQRDLRRPAEALVRLGRVALQHVDFGRTKEARVDADVVLVVQPGMEEGEAAELADAGR